MRVPYLDLVAQLAPLRARILEAVGRVLDHGQFVLGPEVDRLEQRLAERLGVRHVVTLASGTDALRLALRLAGIGPGDEVLTVSHSFLATASSVVLEGATPVFVDIHPDTLSMDPARLADALTPRTRAVIPVHLGGVPCDLAPIADFSRAHDLALVEDCAQAIGASYRGRSVGTTDLGCFSLHPIKSLGALGDGGFLTLADDDRAAHARLLRNNGLRDRDHCSEIAAHSRLDTLQAAILLVELDELDAWMTTRRAHAHAYATALADHFAIPEIPADAEPAPSTFVIRSPDRDALIAHCREHGVDLKVHYPVPIHRQDAFARHASAATRLPVTERAVAEIVSLPCSPALSPAQRDLVIRTLIAFPSA